MVVISLEKSDHQHPRLLHLSPFPSSTPTPNNSAMAITITTPTPLPAHIPTDTVSDSDSDGGVDLDGDISMQSPPSKRHRLSADRHGHEIVTPGQEITSDPQWMRFVYPSIHPPASSTLTNHHHTITSPQRPRHALLSNRPLNRCLRRRHAHTHQQAPLRTAAARTLHARDRRPRGRPRGGSAIATVARGRWWRTAGDTTTLSHQPARRRAATTH